MPVTILAPYPVTNLTGVDATALIDTGSSVSGISVALAQSLNLVGLGKRPLKSAQGEGQIERYAFRVALMPDHAGGTSFPFVFEFNALIGMDILSQCDFDSKRDGRCSLAFG